MTRAVTFSALLISMMVFFAVGVLSGLKSGRLEFLPGGSRSASRSRRPDAFSIDPAFRSRKRDFKNVSGRETTVNGIPFRIWVGSVSKRAGRAAEEYAERWRREGMIVGSAGKEDSRFVNAIDPENMTFYGALLFGSGQKGRDSTLVPYTVDLSDPRPRDTWDPDFPPAFKKKKGIHLRTRDGDRVFEKFLYVDRRGMTRAKDRVTEAFEHSGWRFRKALPCPTRRGKKARVLLFSRPGKDCVVALEPSRDTSWPGTLVALFLAAR